MTNVRLTFDDYHKISVLILHEINFWTKFPPEIGSKEISSLKILKNKIEELSLTEINEVVDDE